MMFNRHDIRRNTCQLFRRQAYCGYDWWWHSLTGISESTGKERAFYIEYFLCNPKFGHEYPVFGQLPENKEKGLKPSYLMVNVGSWGENPVQLHRFFGWKEIEVNYGCPYEVKADDCYATETLLKGSVDVDREENEQHPEWMSDAGSMSWNLKVDKKIAFNVDYGADFFNRRIQLFEMFWHAEGMKTAYEGEIIFNGEKYKITPETCYGYADKNWGKNFTTPWLWLSSNDMVSELTGKRLNNSVFDIGGGRPKIGPVELEGKLLSAMYYEGHQYEFNFSKINYNIKTKFTCDETDDQIIWHVEQTSWTNKMITDITCEKKDMLLINYEAPDGTKRHNRLWNGGNGKGRITFYRKGKLLDVIRVEHVGCEYGEYDAKGPYHSKQGY